jgi:putative DNA primase/helicase
MGEEKKPTSPSASAESPLDDVKKAFASAYAGEGKSRQRPAKPALLDIHRILSAAEPWAGVLGFDEFAGRIVKRKLPPFAGASLGEWSDVDDTRTMMWIAQNFKFQPQEKDLVRAVDAVAQDAAFHEVRDYLQALTWDETPRLASWLTDFLGAADEPYTRIVAVRWMVSAVARVMKRESKADYVLILVGPQGEGKSTVLSILASPWFTDAPISFHDKETSMLIRGKWIVELAELDSFSRADSSASKSFFSRITDRFRVPWGRRPADVPRQCVFAGTVNHFTFLKDDSGNRRYWPVEVGALKLDLLRAQRDQLWAEAYHLFTTGQIWWPRPDEKALFEDVQERHYVGDAWEPMVVRWVSEQLASFPAHEFTTTEVMSECLKLDTRAMDRNAQMRVGACLQRMGLVRERSSVASADGNRDYIYRKARQPGEDQVEL